MTTTLLSTDVVAMLTNTAVEKVDPAFGKVQTQFIGILCGLIAAACYNKFKNTKLPDAFSFFSGICGELGADPELTETFVRMGVDELSVAPSMILKLRKIIREME